VQRFARGDGVIARVVWARTPEADAAEAEKAAA
jgi:hypothetical protein